VDEYNESLLKLNNVEAGSGIAQAIDFIHKKEGKSSFLDKLDISLQVLLGFKKKCQDKIKKDQEAAQEGQEMEEGKVEVEQEEKDPEEKQAEEKENAKRGESGKDTHN